MAPEALGKDAYTDAADVRRDPEFLGSDEPIGAAATTEMPIRSVTMPRIDGAIITPMVISAACTLSFTCA